MFTALFEGGIIERQFYAQFEFGKTRTVEIAGEPWLAGKDVAAALGYSNIKDALSSYVDDEDKLNNKTASSLGQRGGWLIDE